MSDSERKLKLGLIGAGGIAQIAHLPAAKKAKNVDLVAICDVATDLGKAMASKYGIRNLYSDAKSLLRSDEIDAVIIAVADQFHAELTIEALESGKHVLVEKPLASTIEECVSIVDATKRTGKKVQMGCMKRYDPGLQFAKKFSEGSLGKKFASHFWYCDTVFHGEYVHTHAGELFYSIMSRRPATGYGDTDLSIILGHGVHQIDTIRWFNGEIAAVTAKASRAGGNVCYDGIIEFVDGTAGTMQLSSIVKMDWFEGFHIHGDGGSLVVQIFFPYWRRPAKVLAYESSLKEYRTLASGDTDPYERQLEAFADAILNDKPTTPNEIDGLADELVLYSIYDSVKSGRRKEVNAP
ncbi:MAG: Gfo/Idh/MocA family protein [Thermoproteota archaeon]